MEIRTRWIRSAAYEGHRSGVVRRATFISAADPTLAGKGGDVAKQVPVSADEATLRDKLQVMLRSVPLAPSPTSTMKLRYAEGDPCASANTCAMGISKCCRRNRVVDATTAARWIRTSYPSLILRNCTCLDEEAKLGWTARQAPLQ